MSKKSKIYLREESTEKWIKITSTKPEVNTELMETWQNTVAILTSTLDVSSALITKADETTLDILVTGKNAKNPFSIGQSKTLGNGLYCEQVMGTSKPLYVKNALEDDIWRDNPDLEQNMVSYYGMPITWPDGEIFGTICILDDKTITLTDTNKTLFLEFKKAVENSLQLLVQTELLEFYSTRDELTGIYNRRKIKQLLFSEFLRSHRSNNTFSIMVVDLDRFKLINSEYGDEQGDVILKFFVDILLSRLRTVDMLGRWGGDEFVIVCPSTDLIGAQKLKVDIMDAVENHYVENIPDLSCSIGLAEYSSDDESISEILGRADIEMNIEKNKL